MVINANLDIQKHNLKGLHTSMRKHHVKKNELTGTSSHNQAPQDLIIGNYGIQRRVQYF
jgi:hypothetical protein